MHSTIAALLIAATLASPAPAPSPSGPSAGAAVSTVFQAMPVPFPRPSFQQPGRRAPIVLFPPQRPLLVVQPPPRPTIIKVQKGNKGAVIGALIGASVGVVVGATVRSTSVDRQSAMAVGALILGGAGGAAGHAFDFDYIRPGNCGCQ